MDGLCSQGLTVLGLSLAVVAVGIWWWNKRDNRHHKKNVNCAVPGLASTHKELGNLVDMGQAGSLHQFLVKLHQDFGQIASFWWGEQQVLSIASPEIFKQQAKLFDRPVTLFKLFEPLMTKHSIQYANGPGGQNRHSSYHRCFSHEVMSDYFGVFSEIGEQLTVKWLKCAAGNDHIPLKPDCFNAAIKSITRSAYGELFYSEAEVNNLAMHYDTAWSEMESRLAGDFPAADDQREISFQQSKAAMFDIVRKAMEKRHHTQDTARHLLIDVIMESELPEEVKLADALSVLVGGFHTTGFLMTWFFYFVARYPQIQENIVKELDEVLGQETVSLHNMGELVYLRQVLDETLRASVLAPYAARFSDEQTTLGEYTVPPGMPVIHALGVTLQDETLWPDPDRFDPERFSPENRKKMPNFYFEPFGFAGKRKCVGYRFAYAEVSVIVASVLRKVKVKLVDENLTVTSVHGLVTHPKEVIMVHFENRN